MNNPVATKLGCIKEQLIRSWFLPNNAKGLRNAQAFAGEAVEFG
jgi:hypothetical protein